MSFVTVEQTRVLPIAIKNTFVEHLKQSDDQPQTKITIPLCGIGLTYWEVVNIILETYELTPKDRACAKIDSYIHHNTVLLYNHGSVFSFGDNVSKIALDMVDSCKLDPELYDTCPLRGILVDGLDLTLAITISNLHATIKNITVTIKGWNKRNGDVSGETWDISVRVLNFQPNRMYSLNHALKDCDAVTRLSFVGSHMARLVVHSDSHKRSGRFSIIPSRCKRYESHDQLLIPNWIRDKNNDSKIAKLLSIIDLQKVILVPIKFAEIWLEFDEDVAEMPILEIRELKMYNNNGEPHFVH